VDVGIDYLFVQGDHDVVIRRHMQATFYKAHIIHTVHGDVDYK
jgi:hypothetical protein